MITELVLAAFVPLLTAFFEVFAVLTGWLSVDTLDDWAATAGDTLAGVWEWDSWVPITFAMTVLGALLALRMALFGYRMLRHLWDALPFT